MPIPSRGIMARISRGILMQVAKHPKGWARVQIRILHNFGDVNRKQGEK